MIDLRTATERDLWRDALLASLPRLHAADAVDEADRAVEAYRAREGDVLPGCNDVSGTLLCGRVKGHHGQHRCGTVAW